MRRPTLNDVFLTVGTIFFVLVILGALGVIHLHQI